MKITAIYKDHSTIEFDAAPGTVVGNTFSHGDSRPKYFVISKGFSDEEKRYLKHYCTTGRIVG